MSAFAIAIFHLNPSPVTSIVATISDSILTYRDATVITSWSGNALVFFIRIRGIFTNELGMFIRHPLASIKSPILPRIQSNHPAHWYFDNVIEVDSFTGIFSFPVTFIKFIILRHITWPIGILIMSFKLT